MAALREIFASFGFEFDHAGLEKGKKETDTLKESIEGVVAVFAGSELLRGTTEFAEQLGRTGELAEQLQIGTDELQLFQYAAEVSGSSTEELNNSLSILQKSLGHTEAATSAQTKALHDLGIATTTAAGAPRDLNDILPEVFDNFTTLKSEAKEAEVATALFGRAGVRLLPTLRQGKDGIKALKDEMAEYGGPATAEAIESAKQLADDTKRLDHAWFIFKSNLASGAFPQLSKIVEAVGKGVAKLSEWVKGTTISQNATLALAATLAGPLLHALGPFIGKGLKFGAIFLAVDDVIGFLQGKDSLIGRLLDKAFGDGTATAVRAWVNDALSGFTELRTSGISIFGAIGDGWKEVYADMAAAFDRFVIGVIDGWNGMITAIVGSGNFISEALHIDTSGLQGDLAKAQAYKEQLSQKAYERLNPQAAKEQKDKEAADAVTTFGPSTVRDRLPVGSTGTDITEYRSAAAAFAANPAFSRPAPGPDVRTPEGFKDFAKSFRERNTALAAGGDVGTGRRVGDVPAATLASGRPAPVTNNVTVHAPTTVNLPAGTSPSDAAAIARASGKAADQAHRRAAQALVSRKDS